MFKTFLDAFKVKDLRKKILYTLFALVIIRIGCQIAIPGVDPTLVSQMFEQFAGADFISAFTGGAFENLSIFALNITPYITSSIIMQLLTIAIPKLEELQKDGEDGRKKIAEITRYATVILAIIQSVAMSIGFSQKGYIDSDWRIIAMMVVAMTAGSAFLMWMGENITEKGVGNGISIVLGINIISSLPNDFQRLSEQFITGASSKIGSVIGAIVIIAVVIFMVVYIIFLSEGERRIPVQYAKKVQGRKQIGGQSTYIPLKVNTAGVIPVIFTSSLLQLPVIISSLFGIMPASGIDPTTGEHYGFWPMFLKLISSNAWFNFDSLSELKYTLGLLIYLALLIFFAYFYTSITFNPLEVANNMKKAGGFVPGIRPGKPTQEYLTGVLNSIIFIGAIGLSIVAVIPFIFLGVFGAQVSFGGTSIIIIVGVVLETIKQIEAQMVVRHYKGFLSE